MLLVIFFLATSDFSQKPSEIKIDLPQSSANSAGQKQNIVVTVDKKGQIYWKKSAVSKEKLRYFLKKSLDQKKEKKVTIRGDKETSYQDLVAIMDIAQYCGANNIALEVKNSP